MANFVLGARLHDYGHGTPDELFGKVAADGFAAVQLAYKKCVPGVKSYADVTPQLVADTVEAGRRHNIWVAVLGTYVELALDDEPRRTANAADFKSQLAVCKALGIRAVLLYEVGCKPYGIAKVMPHQSGHDGVQIDDDQRLQSLSSMNSVRPTL